MKKIGFIRGIDELGRVTIPKQIRDMKGWNQNTSIEISFDGEKLSIEEADRSYKNMQEIETLEAIAKHLESNKEPKLESELRKVIDQLKY